MKSKHLPSFLIGYVLLFFILFQKYYYVIDPDATGYLSVAEQYAKGNYHNAINGIWSPLGSWLIVPFLKFNINGIIAAKYLNVLYGFFSLLSFYYLLKKLKVHFQFYIASMICALLLLLHFTFYRLFGDLLEVLILLLYLNIILSEKFGSIRTISLAAIAGGIAFYAKYYAFYFVLVHLPVAIFLAEDKNDNNKIFPTIIKKFLIGIFSVCVVASFWIFALNYKYGNYILGSQNFTGSLSYSSFQPRVVFYPPPFNGAYSMFDDISYFKLIALNPFTNTHVFIAQLKLIIFNILKMIGLFNDFSFAFIIIVLISIFFRKNFSDKKRIYLLLSFIIIWPIGFLFFHTEPRYLWILDLCTLLLCADVLSDLKKYSFFNKKLLRIFSLIMIASFCIYPLIELKNQSGTDKNYFEIANSFKKNNISGNLLYNNRNTNDFSKSVIINYLTKCRQYGPFTTDYTNEEISDAIKKYHINYLVLYYDLPSEKEMILQSANTFNASEILNNIYPGIIVLKFNQFSNQ